MKYVIESRGVQSYGVRVVNPETMEVLRFDRRNEAWEYAMGIHEEMPSKNLPLVVVEVDEDEEARARLEELRAELRAERISSGELAELANLREHIAPGDVELLEAAGVPEHGEEQ